MRNLVRHLLSAYYLIVLLKLVIKMNSSMMNLHQIKRITLRSASHWKYPALFLVLPQVQSQVLVLISWKIANLATFPHRQAVQEMKMV